MPTIFRKGRSFYTPGVLDPLRRFGRALATPVWRSSLPMNQPNPIPSGPFHEPGSLSSSYVDPFTGRPPGTDPFPDEHPPPFSVKEPEFVGRRAYGPIEPAREFSPRGVVPTSGNVEEGIEDPIMSGEEIRNMNGSLQIDLMATFFERQVPKRLRREIDDYLDEFGRRMVEIARELVLQQEGVEMGIWPPLAQETLQRKLTDLLLYESGKMVGDLHYEIDLGSFMKTVTLVCDSDYIYYNELGTSTTPARPLLGPAMQIASQELPAELGNALDVAFSPRGGRGRAHFDPFPRIMEWMRQAEDALATGGKIPRRLPFRIPETPVEESRRRHYNEAFYESGDNDLAESVLRGWVSYRGRTGKRD